MHVRVLNFIQVCGDPEASNLDHQTLLFSATVPSWVQVLSPPASLTLTQQQEIARNYLRADRRKDVDLVRRRGQGEDK